MRKIVIKVPEKCGSCRFLTWDWRGDNCMLFDKPIKNMKPLVQCKRAEVK